MKHCDLGLDEPLRGPNEPGLCYLCHTTSDPLALCKRHRIMVTGWADQELEAFKDREVSILKHLFPVDL